MIAYCRTVTENMPWEILIDVLFIGENYNFCRSSSSINATVKPAFFVEDRKWNETKDEYS